MKILITGGAGYKGVILTQKLLNRGYEVTILDNFMYGYNSILHLINNPNLKVIKVDIRNISESHIKDFDCIFHLAGISGMPACAANPHSAESINVESVRKMVNLLYKDQILINASTTSMYGYSEEICDENSSINSSILSMYGKTKYEAEKIIQSRENSISLRFATVFGVSPKMRNDLLVNDFTYKAVQERSIVLFAGKTRRTFVHIEDATDSYVFTLEKFDSMKNDIYNVGSNSLNLTKIDIAEEIKKYVKFELVDSTLPDVDTRNFEISFDKIRGLGFNIKHNLSQGVQELVKLYRFYVQYIPYQII